MSCAAPRGAWPERRMLHGLRADQVPGWLRWAHVQRGYRLGGTWQECVASLWRWHNETLNAWTMMLATAASAGLLLRVATRPDGPARAADLAPFLALHLSALLHLPFSVGYHLLSPMSARAYWRWRALDTFFILVSSALLAYALAAFVLPPAAVAALLAASAALLATGYRRILRVPRGSQVDRAAQVRLLAASVAVYLAPVAWGAWRRPALLGPPAAGACASVALGGLVYLLRFPERWRPGAFDFVGNSHNLMHLCVAAAHLFEWAFVWRAFRAG